MTKWNSPTPSQVSALIPLPDKICQHCGKSFSRGRLSSGRIEPIEHFRHRLYCSHACSSSHRRIFIDGVQRANQVGKHWTYIVRCVDCGKEKLVTYSSPKKVSVRCFNCAQKKAWELRPKKIPEVKPPKPVLLPDYKKLKRIWRGMLRRCSSKANEGERKYYYLRGIKVCEQWACSFDVFYAWAKNHGWKPDLTIERIDNDGDYEPGNCRFATRAEQNYNQSKTALSVEIVRQMHQLRKDGWTVDAIAKRFNNNGGNVSRILRGLAWKINPNPAPIQGNLFSPSNCP